MLNKNFREFLELLVKHEVRFRTGAGRRGVTVHLLDGNVAAKVA
jgi:hypothetical protein